MQGLSLESARCALRAHAAAAEATARPSSESALSVAQLPEVLSPGGSDLRSEPPSPAPTSALDHLSSYHGPGSPCAWP